MAVDVCSDIQSQVVSPRISFSHDLKEADVVPIECCHHRPDALLLESTIDFDFCIGESFSQEVPSADELFANGKILPVEVKKVLPPPKEISPCARPYDFTDNCVFGKQSLEIHPQADQPQKTSAKSSANTAATVKKTEAAAEETKKKMLKEFLSSSFDAEDEKPSAKPFWQFRRSSSLNCENARSNGLIRSLQFLSRSNSTGSAPNPKPSSMLPKIIEKQHSQKEPSISRSSSSSTTQFYSYNSSKGRSLKKSYSSGFRISPVLNIPPNLSIGTVSLFGFCSLFSHSKSKKKNK